MALLMEQYLPPVQEDGIQTNKAVVLGSTLSVAGAVTLSSTVAVTGVTTLTGGLAAISSPQTIFSVGGGVVTAASGNDTACAANTVTWSPIFFPYNMTLTGLGYLIGSVGGTDKTVLSIYSSAGALLGNTTVSGGGTTVGTAANWQAIDLTATLAVTGGTLYYVATNFSGSTAKYRSYPGPGLKFVTGTAAQTLGTPAAITPGTTFNANVGPIMFAY